jgi:sugar-specific transcriptional regulator TrmB/predicted hydrocarbon binding protein
MRFSSMRVDQAVSHIIEMRSTQLDRLKSGFEEVSKNIKVSEKNNTSQQNSDEPRFAVLKERVHIYRKLEQMAESCEEEMVLLLGRFGILHLCRSPALAAVNAAAAKGVSIRIVARLEKRTLRFFSDLHNDIEVRHSDDLDSQGFLQDNTDVVQFLHVETNPVGRGKEDAALVIQSEPFAVAQQNLIDTIWEESVPLSIAETRFTQDRIHDPLKLTIGEGSFLDSIRDALDVTELPDEDLPFNPESFFEAGSKVNAARVELSKGRLSNLKLLGINLNLMLRQVGNRVGQELAFSLRGIEDNIEFLNEMMDWWEYAGLGSLQYGIEPTFHVKVGLVHLPDDNPDVLPMWELDDGIIQGALETRYASEQGVRIRREEGTGESDDLWRYHMILQEDINE